MKDQNPAATSNNKHHMGGYRSEQEWLDDLLGRGKGDFGVTHNYPQIIEMDKADDKK